MHKTFSTTGLKTIMSEREGKRRKMSSIEAGWRQEEKWGPWWRDVDIGCLNIVN